MRGGIKFILWARAARKRAGLSQTEVGKKCRPEISGGRISDIELGKKKPKPAEVSAIFEALQD